MTPFDAKAGLFYIQWYMYCMWQLLDTGMYISVIQYILHKSFAAMSALNGRLKYSDLLIRQKSNIYLRAFHVELGKPSSGRKILGGLPSSTMINQHNIPWFCLYEIKHTSAL